jgi:hypothetical protein
VLGGMSLFVVYCLWGRSSNCFRATCHMIQFREVVDSRERQAIMGLSVCLSRWKLDQNGWKRGTETVVVSWTKAVSCCVG